MTEKTEKVPLTQSLRDLAKRIASAYKSEIVEPAEGAIREWLVEVSSDENPYTEDKVN